MSLLACCPIKSSEGGLPSSREPLGGVGGWAGGGRGARVDQACTVAAVVPAQMQSRCSSQARQVMGCCSTARSSLVRLAICVLHVGLPLPTCSCVQGRRNQGAHAAKALESCAKTTCLLKTSDRKREWRADNDHSETLRRREALPSRRQVTRDGSGCTHTNCF